MRGAPLACCAMVAVGCGRGAPSTAIGGRAAASGPPPCVALDHAGWWQAELVPACPPPPLPAVAAICEPGACARPCEVRGGSTGMHGGTWSARYTYDDAGRMLGSTTDGGETRCTWRDGVLVGCDGDGGPSRAIRAADGAITELVIGDERHAVVRDGARVVAIGAATVRYRDDGRIVAVGDRALTYDDAGRIVGESDARYESAWRYDDRGRLREIVRRLRPPDDAAAGDELDLRERTRAFRYDDQGRLGAMLDTGAHEDDSSATYFAYDCEQVQNVGAGAGGGAVPFIRRTARP